ncbi:hypothetical protein [Streptomyces sp. NPDC000405]|uniref:hypothetical protein n=1 Tax=Streptomyces sp. NPDC000405 TaxID=3161033 RepID=UPI00398CE0D2
MNSWPGRTAPPTSGAANSTTRSRAAPAGSTRTPRPVRTGSGPRTGRADKAGTQRWDIRYAGHRWQVETYGDGTLRFRNDRAHLCLVPAARAAAYVTIEKRDDDARQRWTIVP